MNIRNVWLAAAIIVGLVGLPAQAKNTIDPASIAAMIEKAKTKDPTTDMIWLRRENSRRTSYMAPRWDEVENAYAAFDKDPAKALSLAEKQLQTNPLDIEANFLAEMAYDKLGRKDEEARTHNLLMALLQSVMDGKDGKTPKTAWNAVNVDEEYQVLRLIGFRVKSQALLNTDGEAFDAMTVTERDSDKEVTIHFNINFFFGKQFEGLGL